MEKNHINILKGEWLTDALKRAGYDKIPSNTVLCKTLTGIGATHCEIESKRNSIIIEPTVPVIIGKAEDNNNILAVYNKCSLSDIQKYMRSDVASKKIMTTPESFNKINRAANEIGIDIFNNYFCLFDECEKITQDVSYRRTISNPISDFFEFKDKAFVSATTLPISHPMFDKQKFRSLVVKPDFDYKKNLNLIVTNSYYKTIKNELERLKDSKHICIFFNVTSGIAKLIKELKLEDYKIFCSEKSAKKIVKEGYTNVASHIDNVFAKYNFFTCRFFSAVDIWLHDKPDIIILTDLHSAEWTKIDPFTESIQIQGRFRRHDNDCTTYNSLTHITNVNPNIRALNKEGVKAEIETQKESYEKLIEQKEQEADEQNKKTIQKEIDKLTYKELLGKNGELNHFSVDNRYNEERVKFYYQCKENLLKAYHDTGFFNVVFSDVIEPVGTDDLDKLRQEQNDTKRRENIVSLLGEIEQCNGTQEQKKSYTELLKENPKDIWLIEAYQSIGKDAIINANFKKDAIEKLMKEYSKEVAERQRFMPEVLSTIKESFETAKKYDRNEAKSILGSIYQRFGIKRSVTQDTILDYYDGTKSNHDGQWITLKSFKG